MRITQKFDPPTVSAQWLADHMNAPDVKIVDATWTAAFMNPDFTGREMYEAGHISGAVFFDIDKIADTNCNLPHMLPDAVSFAEHMETLGLGDGHKIIVYDQNHFMASARVWWMLRTMGHADVAVLDGGMHAWLAIGGNVEDLAPHAIDPRTFTVEKRHDLERSLVQMRQAVESRHHQIIDARNAPRFQGNAPEPRPGLTSGHMPGALNLPHEALLTPQGVLKPQSELEKAFVAAGVDLDRPIITTCGSGVTAAILALALAVLGRNDVAVYDGSWAEWGASEQNPVETGPAAVKKA